MGGGGGGIFGTVLNVVSFVVPAVRPFAIAYNMINSAANGNVLGMASGAFGVYNGGFDSWSGDGGWGGSGDSYYGSGDNWNGGYGDSFSPDGSMPSDSWVNDVPYTEPPPPMPDQIDFNVDSLASNPYAPQNLQEIPNGDVGYQGTAQDLQTQIDSGTAGAQSVAGDAVDYAKQQGIAAGSGDVAQNTLKSLYDPTKFDTTSLTKGLDLGTTGGYEGAQTAVGSLNNTVQNLGGANVYNANSGMGTLGGSSAGSIGTPDPLLNTEVRSFGPQTQAMTQDTTALSPDMTGSNSGNYSGGSSVMEGVSDTPIQGNDSANSALDNRFTGNDPWSDTRNINKDFSKITGYGMDNGYGKGVTGLPVGTEGSLKNMFNGSNGSNRNRNLFQAPSVLGMLGRGAGAVLDVNQGQKATELLQNRMNMSDTWVDPNRARGDTANQLWTQNYQDPNAGYADFMRGAGRDITNQARLAAARNGRRADYMPKLASDLSSLWMKNQLARGDSLSRGFVNGTNNYAAGNSVAPALATSVRNQYAPIGQAISGIDRQFQLSDLFGNEDY